MVKLYKVDEVVRMTSLSRSMVNKEIYSGRLHSVKVGRARRIPAAALWAWLELLEEEARAG